MCVYVCVCVHLCVCVWGGGLHSPNEVWSLCYSLVLEEVMIIHKEETCIVELPILNFPGNYSLLYCPCTYTVCCSRCLHISIMCINT